MAVPMILYESEDFLKVKVSTHMLLLLLQTVFFSVAVNILSMVIIKHISSVMLKLIVITRNAVLVLYSVIFIGDDISELQLLGYSISIVSFVVYSYSRT